MTKAVKIPVTVKMRAGWDADEINAPELARRIEDAGAAAVTVHGRTAAQSYSGSSDWDLIAQGCPWRRHSRSSAAATASSRRSSSIVPAMAVCQACSSAVAHCATRGFSSRRLTLPPAGRPTSSRLTSAAEFLLEYIDMLLSERVDEASGFRHVAPGQSAGADAHPAPARGRERWVINKIRALNSWYTKGLDNGSHLRVAVNRAESIAQLQRRDPVVLLVVRNGASHAEAIPYNSDMCR